MHRVTGGDPLLFEARENVLGAYQQLRDSHPAFPEVLRDFQVIKSTTNSTACTLLPLQADIVAAANNAEDGHHSVRTKCQPDKMPTKGWHFVRSFYCGWHFVRPNFWLAFCLDHLNMIWHPNNKVHFIIATSFGLPLPPSL